MEVGMPSETANAIAYVGAFVGLLGGGVALFNSHKAVRWKRAELASSYLKELFNNQELVFACRALEWYKGKLAVPEQLRPLLPNESKVIVHDFDILRKAMASEILLEDMIAEPRLQVYRTAVDNLLSWLSLVDNALERKLFVPSDIREAAYWVRRIETAGFMDDFIRSYGYAEATERLRTAFRPLYEKIKASTISRGGFGESGRGRSAGG
jgi:hypothetical protein